MVLIHQGAEKEVLAVAGVEILALQEQRGAGQVGAVGGLLKPIDEVRPPVGRKLGLHRITATAEQDRTPVQFPHHDPIHGRLRIVVPVHRAPDLDRERFARPQRRGEMKFVAAIARSGFEATRLVATLPLDAIVDEGLELETQHDRAAERVVSDLLPAVRIVEGVEVVRGVARRVHMHLLEATCCKAGVHQDSCGDGPVGGVVFGSADRGWRRRAVSLRNQAYGN